MQIVSLNDFVDVCSQAMPVSEMKRFFSVIGDNASVVKATYRLAQTDYPWLIPSFCAGHQLATWMKLLFTWIPLPKPKRSRRTGNRGTIVAMESSDLDSSGSDGSSDSDYVPPENDSDDEYSDLDAASSFGHAARVEEPTLLEVPEEDCEELEHTTRVRRTCLHCYRLNCVSWIDCCMHISAL